MGQTKSHTSWTERKDAPSRKPVSDWWSLRPGDHIAWHRDYSIWHHAIVEWVDRTDGKIHVIHYNGAPTKQNGNFATVRRDSVKATVGIDFCRYDYSEVSNTYSLQQALQRAKSRLEEAEYNPLTNNCEHFARWCHTDRKESEQVGVVKHRAGMIALCTAARVAISKVVPNVVPDVVPKVAPKVVRKVVPKIVPKVVKSGSSLITKGKAVASKGIGIGVGLVGEGITLVKNVFQTCNKYKNGLITKADRCVQLCKSTFECVGGSLGCVLGCLIPIPVVGPIVGIALSTVGRWVGSMFGKFCGKCIAALL